MTFTVSVALCTHNGERFVGEQVKSILSQTLLPSQLVISDDASSDETLSIVESTLVDWRRAHPETPIDVVTVINREALGVARNFEQAILATTGDLVALCDQDDVWLPERLATMVPAFEARPELLLLHTDAYLVDAAGSRLTVTLLDALEVSPRVRKAIHEGRAFTELLKRNFVTGATTVLRRSFVDTVTPFPQNWLHDEWLAISASARGEVDLIDQPLLDYRQHGANEVGAERLSTFGKLRRMVEPGVERNRRLYHRAELLVARFDDLEVSDADRRSVREKLAHEGLRFSLGRHRLSRILPVLRELRTGRYGLYGRGYTDALRDLLQPL